MSSASFGQIDEEVEGAMGGQITVDGVGQIEGKESGSGETEGSLW